jgi:Arc/MetJ-type ribon-helix-helix transcriptional regulator
MAKKTVVLRLNQQQLELLDRTIAAGAATDRVALVRRALREYATKRARPVTTPGAAQ